MNILITGEMPLDVAVAAIEGYTWFWSKHDYWSIWRPNGNNITGCGSWTPFDPNSGKPNPLPRWPEAREIGYHPTQDSDEILRLMSKHRLSLSYNGAKWQCSWGDGDVSAAEAGEAVCMAVVALTLKAKA